MIEPQSVPSSGKSLRLGAGLVIFSVLVTFPAWTAQRGEAPRRLENPADFTLPGKARVEFRNLQSPVLGKQVQYSVFLPPNYDREPNQKFPVVYFLHGLHNNHTSWATQRYGDLPVRIEILIDRGQLPHFVMIHPDGQNSLYTDSHDGNGNYESYIHHDLVQEVQQKYRVRIDRMGRAIGGVSMGGYGALKIAMRHPEFYASVAATSPIVFLGEDPFSVLRSNPSRRSANFLRLVEQTFGNPTNKSHWKENSLEELARNAALNSLNIYFAYGTADRYNLIFPMERGIRSLEHILKQRGIAHVCRILKGKPHGWELVAAYLEETLAFLTQTF